MSQARRCVDLLVQRKQAMLLDISCRHNKTTYLLTDGLAAGEARLQDCCKSREWHFTFPR